MPAIRVLGCWSRLGTWSTACRRAGFLQLSAKPAGMLLVGSRELPAVLVLTRMQRHDRLPRLPAPWGPRRAVTPGWVSWRGAVVL